eukprot:scaffold83421_cov63-Phaeocystis_antarctica.AAC.1
MPGAASPAPHRSPPESERGAGRVHVSVVAGWRRVCGVVECASDAPAAWARHPPRPPRSRRRAAAPAVRCAMRAWCSSLPEGQPIHLALRPNVAKVFGPLLADRPDRAVPAAPRQTFGGHAALLEKGGIEGVQTESVWLEPWDALSHPVQPGAIGALQHPALAELITRNLIHHERVAGDPVLSYVKGAHLHLQGGPKYVRGETGGGQPLPTAAAFRARVHVHKINACTSSERPRAESRFYRNIRCWK